MPAAWIKKRVLITARTYPVPANKGVEVSCTAGVTAEGEWIRLYPIPYRSLDEDRRFVKYEWIDVEVTKARGDTRPESFTPNLDSIKIVNSISTADGWRARRELLHPLERPSLCHIQSEQERNAAPTLGFLRPKQITKFVIENDDPNWSAADLAKLNQTLSLFETAPAVTLEKIPFKFKYEFRCTDERCNGHLLSCTDWELHQSYRKWRGKYGDTWEKALRQKYEDEMINRFDTHFFVGNLHQYPNAFIIIGLFYPPRQVMGDLFSPVATSSTG